MYAETAVRDGFVIRPRSYYHDAWGMPFRAGRAQALLAEVEGSPVAGLIVLHFGPTAWYFYGMSRDAHRDRMPSYLLQWEAIRWAKGRGLTTYDFWGAPDLPDADDPMFGVYRFKAGFGAKYVRTLGAWDWPLRPLAHRLYTVALPRVLAVLRSRQRAATRRAVEAGLEA
jgi:lipid II:glycine glycyltransferase (peptidoglycan interpeptide bridge formation enzyme)